MRFNKEKSVIYISAIKLNGECIKSSTIFCSNSTSSIRMMFAGTDARQVPSKLHQ